MSIAASEVHGPIDFVLIEFPRTASRARPARPWWIWSRAVSSVSGTSW